MRKYFYCFFIVFFVNTLSIFAINSNGVLILNDGREYRGKLISIDDTSVVFVIDGKSTSFERIIVSKINLERDRAYNNTKDINEIKDNEIQAAFAESKKWKPTDEYDSAILLDKTAYKLEKDFSVKIKIKKIIKILNENGKDLSTQYFYYLKNFYKASLTYAFTILPDGKVFSIDEQALNDEPINNLYADYDRLNRVKFGFKNIDVESIIVWEAEITGISNESDNPFFLEKNLVNESPVSKRIVEISLPEEMNLKSFISKGILYEKKPEMIKSKSGNKTVYRYEESDVPGFVNDEDNLPPANTIYPFLYSGLETGWEKITADFYDRYFSAPVAKKIADLARKTAGEEKDESLVLKKIYEYVNRQIDPVDIGFSDAGYVPSSEEKMADFPSLNVLDKSYLFTRMCNALSINASLLYYRNNAKGGLIEDCPSLKQFDSVICEAGGRYYSFEDGNYSVFQRDGSSSEAYALDVSKKSSKPFLLKKILPEENSVKVSIKGELKKDDVLILTRTTEIKGSAGSSWRARRFMTKEELGKWENSRLSGLGRDVDVVSFRFINPLNDFNKPVVFEEKLKIRKFSYSSGKNLKLFQLPDLNYKAGSVSKPERIFPFVAGEISTALYVYEIKLPAGFRVIRMADNVKAGNDLLKFDAESRVKGGTIMTIINSIVNKSVVDAALYRDLKNLYETKAKFSEEWYIIKSGK